MKTVAEMAREAGIDAWWDSGDERREVLQEHLERLADLVRADEREACSRVRAAKPKKLKAVGTGALLGEQQYCFEKGYKKGVASLRAAIRARGEHMNKEAAAVKLARELGIDAVHSWGKPTPGVELIERFFQAAYNAGAADEREALANYWEARHGYDKYGVAAEIRAREEA